MAFTINDLSKDLIITEDNKYLVSELYYDGRYYVNEGKWDLKPYTGIISTREPGCIGSYYKQEVVNGVEHGRYNMYLTTGC